MVEDVLGVFEGRCVFGEYGISKPCVLFFARDRLIFGILEGISSKSVVGIVIFAAISFVGLFLRNLILFFGGIAGVIIVGVILVISDYIMRHLRKNKVKKLPAGKILRENRHNFEIAYSDIVKVKHVSYEKFEGSSRFFLPTLPELTHSIEFATSQKNYSFILDRRDLEQCMELLEQFVKEKIEKNESEES